MQFHAKYPLIDSQSEREFAFSYAILSGSDLRGFYDQVEYFTAFFNNMRTLKFESRWTNAFFAAVNEVFGGSSKLTTAAEHCFVVWTEHNYLITPRSADGWQLGVVAEHLIDVREKCICRLSFEF